MQGMRPVVEIMCRFLTLSMEQLVSQAASTGR